MVQKKQLSLKEIQSITLDILKKFDAFCKQNNLRYSLAYGTLIGAVRHKGFIPWDDDIDVLMPREDYERMCSLGYNDGKYELKNYNISDDYYFSFAKMTDNQTVVVDRARNEKDMGLFIDIFPMDFFYAENESQLNQYGKKGLRKQFFARTIGIKPFYYKRARYIVRSVISLAVTPFKKNIFDSLNSLGTVEKEATHCSMLIHNDNFPEFFDASIWNNLVCLDFEDNCFPVFEDYDTFLKTVYGDYMTPPPPEYQKSVHGIEAYLK